MAASEFQLTSSVSRYFFTHHDGLRTVADGVLNSSTTVTSATAVFTANDVGAAIVGTGIPGGATIVSRTNATTVVISAAATATSSGVTLTITQTATLGLATFQTAINTDFASYFTTVPTLSTQPGAPTVANLIVSASQVLSIPFGSWAGRNAGDWQVLTNAQLLSLFTPSTI